jgi:C1A family cysteine protease
MAGKYERIGVELGMGWLPDYPDFRDYTIDKKDVAARLEKLGQRDSIRAMLKKVSVEEPVDENLPASVDLREWCSPIEHQGSLGSCTAHAGVALVEYYERRAFGRHVDASRLFLYKVTRNLLQWTGDRGAFIRTAMAAIALFGVPPEEYWPYSIEEFDNEPSSFCYAFAQDYRAVQYFRLDPPDTQKDTLLKRIKSCLASGLPEMFGFTVFSSIEQAGDDGKIPFPGQNERILGGHAVAAVGFDDEIRVKNMTSGVETTGAFLIRNSWGTEWGDSGYGWLPYDYVLNGLAADWWSIIKNEWIDTKNFGL